MRTRPGNLARFLSRLLILLFLCLTPAVLMAEGPFPSHGKDVASRSCLLFEVLTPQAVEAIFAGGHGPQGFNLVACRQAGRIILWDEGPAKGTKLVPVRVNTKD